MLLLKRRAQYTNWLYLRVTLCRLSRLYLGIYVYTYIYIYMHTYMHIISINEKRPWISKKQRDIHGGLEGGKETEKWCNYNLKSKRKRGGQWKAQWVRVLASKVWRCEFDTQNLYLQSETTETTKNFPLTSTDMSWHVPPSCKANK